MRQKELDFWFVSLSDESSVFCSFNEPRDSREQKRVGAMFWRGCLLHNGSWPWSSSCYNGSSRRYEWMADWIKMHAKDEKEGTKEDGARALSNIVLMYDMSTVDTWFNPWIRTKEGTKRWEGKNTKEPGKNRDLIQLLWLFWGCLLPLFLLFYVLFCSVLDH